MLKVGLTGGIGSGKTTVARIFSILGVPVYYADDAAKELMNTNEDLVAAIKKEFGEDSYRDNKLDRKFLASIVFSDPLKLEKLNALTHPATISHANEWISRQNTPYIIKEAALLFESGAAKHLDRIIGVNAPTGLRIKRAAERDHVSAEEIIKRMKRQMDEAEKMKLCDDIIINDETQFIITQVLALHKKLLNLSEA